MKRLQKDHEGTFQFPEPLYETYCLSSQDKICLVCGHGPVVSVLRTTSEEIVPLCEECRINWNWYGYSILRKIKPKPLIWAMTKRKLSNWFSTQSITQCYHDLRQFGQWAKKMKKYI